MVRHSVVVQTRAGEHAQAPQLSSVQTTVRDLPDAKHLEMITASQGADKFLSRKPVTLPVPVKVTQGLRSDSEGRQQSIAKLLGRLQILQDEGSECVQRLRS